LPGFDQLMHWCAHRRQAGRQQKLQQ
jgi:hypothetical protein